MYSANFFNYLGLYSNMGGEASPGTPRKLANEMLDRLPAALWSDPNKTFLDPSMTNGMFYFLMVERLFDGLAEKIPDPYKRITHILTKQVWGYEMNEAPFEFVKKMLNKQFGIGSSINIEPNLCYNNILDEELNMKFDVVVMNPPYNPPRKEGSKGTGHSQTIYQAFVKRLMDDGLRQGGYMLAVHPPKWRKPESNRAKTIFSLLVKNNHMTHLSMRNKKEGISTFGAGTAYDFYCVKKLDKQHKMKTMVSDQQHNNFSISLYEECWFPGFEHENVSKLIANKGEKTCKVLFSRSAYGSDKRHISKTNDSNFRFPVYHSITKSGVRIYFSNTDSNGFFGIPKVIVSKNEKIRDIIVDHKGVYGMTEYCFGIPIKDQKDGESLKTFLMTKEFGKILESTKWTGPLIEWRMFNYFKDGFWR
jgi:hypothetical protein